MLVQKCPVVYIFVRFINCLQKTTTLFDILIFMFSIYRPKEPKKTKTMPRQSSSLLDWLKWFPIQAIALAVILGLLYLASPESLHKLIDFSLRFSPELKYVNGPPPV